MPNDKLKSLYDATSKSYDLGSYDQFASQMSDPTKRKSFYDAVSSEYDLGDYKTFESKISGTVAPVTVTPTIKPKSKTEVSAIAVENQYIDLYGKKVSSDDKLQQAGIAPMETGMASLNYQYQQGQNRKLTEEEKKVNPNWISAKKQADASANNFNAFNERISKSKFVNDIYKEAQTKINKLTNEGFTKSIDESSVLDIVRTKKVATQDSPYEKFLVNTVKNKLEFDLKKPQIEAETKKQLAGTSLPTNVNDLINSAQTNVESFAKTKSKEIKEKYNPQVVEYSSAISKLNDDYKSFTDNLKSEISNTAFLQQNYAGIPAEQIQQIYTEKANSAFKEYTKNYELYKSKYNKVNAKMQSDFMKSIDLYKTQIQKDTKDKGAKIYDAVTNAVKKVQMQETEGKKMLFETLGKANPYSVLGASTASGLANWLSGVSTALEVNTAIPGIEYLAANARELAKSIESPEAEIKNLKDLFDPIKFSLSAGKMGGQMLPDITLAAATRGVLGEGLISTIASGTVSWIGEATQAAYGNYNMSLEQGIDPLTAQDRAKKTYAGYLVTLPLAMLEMEAMFGKFGKKTIAGKNVIGTRALNENSALERFGKNLGIELGSETIEESLQNPVDKAIMEGRDVSVNDYKEAFSPEELKKTFFSVAPTSVLMTGPGSARESGARNERLLPNWVELQAGEAYVNSIAKSVLKSGGNVMQAALESMRHNGMISEQMADEVKGVVITAASHIQTAREKGLNKKEQGDFAGLMFNVQFAQEKLAEVDPNNPEAVKIAQNRVDEATKIANDFLNTKNGNYAVVTDENGDKYIVTHDTLNDMLNDDTFRFDVKNRNVTVELKANKNQPASFVEASGKLMQLNKNFEAPTRRYKNQDGFIMAVYRALGVTIPVTPTVITSADQLLGQPVEYVYNNKLFKGTLVQEGQRIIFDDGNQSFDIANIDEARGMKPEELGIRYVQKTPRTGKKISVDDNKLNSVVARYGGKVEPQALINIIMDAVEGSDRNIVSSLVYTYDNAFHQNQTQRQVKDAQTEPGMPEKKLDIQTPELGQEIEGEDVASDIAKVGDSSTKGALEKIIKFIKGVFLTREIDLDELYDNDESFRNRVELERLNDKKRYQAVYNNTQDVPAVLVNDKVEDGMGRLAQKYLEGQKTAIVYDYIKPSENATKKSKQQKGVQSGRIGKREGTQEEQAPETDEADNSYSVVGSKGEIKGRKGRQRLVILNNIAKAVRSIYPQLEIKAHNSISDFREYVRATLGDEAADLVEDNDAGQIFYRNGQPVAIHIMLDTESTTTLGHEAWHAVLNAMYGRNSEVFNDFVNDIDSTLREYGYKEIADGLKSFAINYGDANFASEYLAELGGKLTAENIDLKRITKGRTLLEAIKSMINSLFGRQIFTVKSKPAEVLNFMISLSNDLNKGVDISDIVQQSQESTVDEGVSSDARNPKKDITESQAKSVAEATESKTVSGKVQPSMILRTVENKQEVIRYSGESSLQALRDVKPGMYISRAKEFASKDLGSPVMGKPGKDELAWADQAIENFIGNVVSNLLFVYDNIPAQVRDISKLWYDGANIIAQEMASKYDITLEQASAVIASQSPQKPWFDNVHLAHFIIDYVKNSQDAIFSQNVLDYYKLTAEKYPKQLEQIPTLSKSIGKKFSELNIGEKSIMIRYVFDNMYERNAPLRIPTGHIVSKVTSMSSFSGYDTIAKAISVLEDGSEKNISDNIGRAFKVRNFYNNIASPQTDNEVTIDTHAMAASYLLPLGTADKEFIKFDEATYAVFAEAYRRAAKERGILAREMQSITWEGVRALFPSKEKVGKKKIMSQIWADYAKGSITLQEAQQKTKENGGEFGTTDWSRFIDTIIEEGGNASYIAELPFNSSYSDTSGIGESGRVEGGLSAMGEGDRETGSITSEKRYAPPTRSNLKAVEDVRLFRGLNDSQKQLLAKGVTLWQQWMTSYGLLGKNVKIAEEYKEGYVSDVLINADKAVKDAIKAIKDAKEKGIVYIEGEASQKIAEVLQSQGITPTAQLIAQELFNKYTPEFLSAMNNMRQHIDALTDEMIVNGVITDQDEIDLFNSNKGKYMGRFYEKIMNGEAITLSNIKDKLKNVDQAVLDRATDLIRQEVKQGVINSGKRKGLSDEDINKLIELEVEDTLNKIIEGLKSPYTGKPLKGSVNMKALMARKDIMEPIRELLGEETNPIKRYYATIAKMSDVIASYKYLNTVKQIGMGKFLFEKNDPNRPEGLVELSSKENKNLGPLAGLYTFREIRDEFRNYNIFPGSQENPVKAVFDKAMGTAKYIKTVGNLPTHVKNAASNIGILVNNGYLFDIPSAIEFITQEDNAFEQAFAELRKRGVLNNNLGAGELKSYFEKNNDVDKVLQNKFKPKNPVKAASNAITKLYNLEDDVFKVIAYICELQRVSKSNYGKDFSSLTQSDRIKASNIASEKVKDVIPLFGRVPAFVKGMNKYLFLGTFMSFSAEAVRIGKNTAIMAIDELSNPETRFIGAKRLAGMLAWNSVYGALTYKSAAAVGSFATGAYTYASTAIMALVADDDKKYRERLKKESAIRLYVREHNGTSELFFEKAKDGKVVYYDIGSVNPYQFLNHIFNKFDQLSKDDTDGVVVDIAKSIAHGLSPFLATDFIAQILIDIASNKDKYGNEIYTDSSSDKIGDSGPVKIAKQIKYASQAFTPGMVTSAMKTYELSKEGKTEEAKAEAVSTTLIRKYTIDVPLTFYSKAKEFNKNIETLESNYAKVYNKNVPQSEKDASYNENLTKLKNIISAYSDYYNGALELGASKDDLLKSLVIIDKKGSGLSRPMIYAIISGDSKMPDELLLTKERPKNK